MALSSSTPPPLEMQDPAAVPADESTFDDLQLVGERGFSEGGALQFEYDSPAACNKSTRESLKIIIISCVVFAVAVTIALIVSIKYDPYRMDLHGGVVSEAEECSTLGGDILKKGGSAVDAAISALLCQGVVHPHSSGLGGGGFMVVRQHQEGLTQVIDFREAAPLGWSQGMTANKRGLYVATPGQLQGLAVAHKQFGRLSWKEVVESAAAIADTGFNMSQVLFDAIKASGLDTSPATTTNKSRHFWFDDSGHLINPNVHVTRPLLGATLHTIAEEGEQAFYTGDIAAEIVAEVRANHGILTAEDLVKYKANKVKAIKTTFKGRIVETTPAPSSGPLLLLLLNMLENHTATGENSTAFYHYLLESVKLTQGQRQHLADPAFVNTVTNTTQKLISKQFAASLLKDKFDLTKTFLDVSHYGGPVTSTAVNSQASHVTVIGPHDDYVSISSSLNGLFGARIITSDGIVLNNQMVDFDDVGSATATVQNRENVATAGKRPLSSLLPVLIHTDRRPCLRIAIGSNSHDGVMTSISSMAQVIVSLLTGANNVSEAIRAPRLQSSISDDDMRCQYEDSLPTEVVTSLRNLGHNMTAVPSIGEVDAVSKDKETVSVYTDERGSSTEWIF